MTTINKIARAIRTTLPFATVMTLTTVPHVYAQDAVAASGAAEETVEKLVVTGMRGSPRSVADSPVPIDVLSSDELNAVAFTDTNDVLKTLVPSYSVSREPISDGGTFIRPATLRGMPTDKTLVLVNNKRRHRAALVTTGSSGTQGPDVATIPSSALKTVEVLRDGAAAQYGSDAIAGVINFHLKDNSDGGSLTVDWGKYTEGDGESYNIAGNIGFALGESGFLSISGEISSSDDTVRAQKFCAAASCFDENDSRYDPNAWYHNDPAFREGIEAISYGEYGIIQPWGQPEAEATRIFFNSGFELAKDINLYAFGNYSKSEANGPFNYRGPNHSSMKEIRLEDGSIFSQFDRFPAGYTPRFHGDVYDYSFAAGIEGVFANGLIYDFSGRYGSNEIRYELRNTSNPSMGDLSPTSFKPGNLINEELQFQADFVQDFEVSGLSSPLVLAFGLSYMDESYEVELSSDPASYGIGSYAYSDPWGFCDATGNPTARGATVAGLDCTIGGGDPVYNTLNLGADGFPGYGPDSAGKYTRDSYAAYVDVSADITDNLFLQTALRYEDYDDFGSELVGKLAFRYVLTDTYSMRGSFGTGFRAPTPGQHGTKNVSTRMEAGNAVVAGLYPAHTDVAQALGGKPLSPETSVNYTLGLTADYGRLTLTMDYYRIAIEDRFYATSGFKISNDPTSGTNYDNYLALINAGVSEVEARSLGEVYFFQNAFDTLTQGVDMVANYSLPWRGGLTTFTASGNYNKTEFDSDPSQYLTSEEDRYDFENATPKFRGVFSVKHNMGDLTFLARANYYGSYKNSDAVNGVIFDIQEFDPQVLFDLEASYQINDIATISAGGRNIFDTYPDKTRLDGGNGRVYWASSPVDWQGAYYYLKLSLQF